MLKRPDAQIFVIFHKEGDIKENSLFTPLQCGTKDKGYALSEYNDYTGNNISHLNKLYCELTGIYWIYKNVNDIRLKYVGQTPYRRLLKIDENFDFDKTFETNDIIVSKMFHDESGANNLEQYGLYHNIDDLINVRYVFENFFPDYLTAYDIFTKSEGLYNGNGFVMRHDDYNKFCDFIFNFFIAYQRSYNLFTEADFIKKAKKDLENGKFHFFDKQDVDNAVFYEKRTIGFLSERLFNIYVIKNFKAPLEVEYELTETDY